MQLELEVAISNKVVGMKSVLVVSLRFEER